MSIPKDKIIGLLLFSGFISGFAVFNAGKRHGGLLHLLRSGPAITTRMIFERGYDTLITQQSENFLNQKWKKKVSCTTEDGEESECELEITNDLQEPIVLCWVDEKGNLHNYYPINDKSIKDKSVSNIHTEYTYGGHCFVGMKKCSQPPKHLADVPDEQFVFLYVPHQGKSTHKLTLQQSTTSDSTISQVSMFLRKRPRPPTIEVITNCIPKDLVADELIDTTQKLYQDTIMHGFQIKYEPSLFEHCPDFHRCFNDDLAMVTKLLPHQACKKLQEDTIFWLNKSITYGKKSNPVVGRACTFHPNGGAVWLAKNGLTVAKEGGIEFMCTEDYMKSRHHWGPGGVIVHELCHAFHNKLCSLGFDSELVRTAYDTAMEKQLYHAVKVHGPQGEKGLQKAYACTNCMEYFAELSVAYLWNEDDTEYNKWFPFNRKQLFEYDVESYRVIETCWQQYEESK